MTDVPKYVPDKDELKRLLPIRYVCAKLGIVFDENDQAICPFHEDDRPSLYLFTHDDGETHFACQPCGVSGDIYTLLMKHYNLPHPYGFKEALEHALALYDELPEDWNPPAPVQRERKDIADWEGYILRGQDRATDDSHQGYLAARLRYAPMSQPALLQKWDSFIRKSWRWGVGDEGEILIPHYDVSGRLVGCKTRKPDGEKGSLKGSSYAYGLYGAWRGKRNRFALITEGESDCIFASVQVAREKLPVDVYSLPGGATHFEDHWVDSLKYYEYVYLVFDPDNAGVKATWVWLKALKAAGLTAKTCFLPLGRDLREAQPTMEYLLETATIPLDMPEQIMGTPMHGYVREGKEDQIRRVTSWYLDPVARIKGSDDPGWDVLLHNSGTVTETTIQRSDFINTNALQKWCHKHDISFHGREDDMKKIAAHLEWKGCVVPTIYQTDQVGIHPPPETYRFAGPSAVFPEGYIGKMPWRYIPSARTSDARDKTLLPTQGSFNWSWLEDFLRLSHTAVMHPLMAWLVAAARRNEAERFPLMFIAGSSGVGKSTLAMLGLKMMGSQIVVDLGNNTPFVLTRTLASSTTVPVFIDEWTRQSRRETREAFQSSIPVLYVGGHAERGQADLSVQTYRLTSPVIVAGEDRFMLDREIERMVAISPSRDRQNRDALTRILNQPLERFGQLLYSWLTTDPELPKFNLASNTTRADYNRHVLDVGWQTLYELLMYVGQFEEIPELPEKPDLSELDFVFEDDEDHVYVQALVQGASMKDQDHIPVVWLDPEGRGTWVRFQTLTGLIKARQIDIPLPGGHRAMKDYFKELTGESPESADVTPPESFKTVRAQLVRGFKIAGDTDPRGSGWIPS